MGTRIIRLLPNRNGGIVATWKTNPGLGVAAGVQNGPLWSAWEDGAWDGTDGPFCSFVSGQVGNPYGNCSFGYYAPNRNQGADARLWCRFEDPPTLVRILRVKFSCRWDYSARPTNPYIFPQGYPNGFPAGPQPPTNSHGPRSRIMFRNRANTDWLYGPYWNAGFSSGSGSYPATGSPVTGNHYCHMNRPNCANRPAVYGSPHTKVVTEYELTSHPEGGIFTFEDLLNLRIGIHSQCDNPAWVQYGPVAFVQVRFFHYYVELEVADPQGFVRNLRYSSAHSLRLLRRPRNRITLSTAAKEAIGEVGSLVFLSHPRGIDSLGEGWPVERLERRPGQILQRTYWPEGIKVVDELQDLHEYRATAWGAFRIGIPWSPELSGMSYLDQGGGFEHERAQDGWSPRPGDRVMLRVPESEPLDDLYFPNLSEDGLVCAGGGDVEESHRNTNPGNAGAGWSTSLVGDVTTSTDSTAQIAEELGYEDSQRLVFGPAGGQGWFGQNVGAVAAGELFHAEIRVRNVVVSGGAEMFYALFNSFGEWFDFSTRTWVAGGGTPTAWIALDNSGPVAELSFDGIPIANAGTLAHFVGRFPTSPATPNVANSEFVLSLTSLQRGGAANGDSYGARPALASLDLDITRVPDVFRMPNDGANRFWFRERGAALFEFRPFFRAADMPIGETKPIARAQNVGSGFDQLSFVQTASGGFFSFVRFDDALATLANVSIQIVDSGGTPIDLTREHIVRCFIQWNGPEGSEQEAPYQVRIGYLVFDEATGTLLGSGTAFAAGLPPDGVEDFFLLGSDTAPRYLDGWMRTFEVRRNPLYFDESLWRR